MIREFNTSHTSELPGVLVISLDFELMWGVRDHVKLGHPYVRNLMGARRAIPRILSLMEEFDVAATWATVGFLFAVSRAELEEITPGLRPIYADKRLSPYEEEIGEDEQEDPLHFATSLIERIRRTARQEIATHTYAHYYCGEEGHSPESFRADLQAAQVVAARRGVGLRSIVFPRNQHNPRYDNILLEMGITSFRGNPASFAWRFPDGAASRGARKRLMRLADSYLGLIGPSTTPWAEILQTNGLVNVRASYPLRPYAPEMKPLEPMRLKRIKSSIRYAARNREIFHIWWHPHNFGVHIDENLSVLRKILEDFDRLRRSEGIVSLTMADVADGVRPASGVRKQDAMKPGGCE